MKRILLLGAGRSAATLILYLQELVMARDWQLTIGDLAVQHLESLQSPRTRILPMDLHAGAQVQAEIQRADLVISLLPPPLHPIIARYCLEYKRHLVTASYVSPELRDLDKAAREVGLLFLMEAGLDPGLDHMSAMAAIDKIKAAGGQLTAYKSYTGGLVAPSSDTNPWHYKFSWNPRNVVLAGQGTARYLENGQYKFIPYHQLFCRLEPLTVPGLGEFDGYANRDSLLYREPYGLQDIPTLLRGTLRWRGFCQAWHLLVQLGLTEDHYHLPDTTHMTYRQFMEAFLPAAYRSGASWIERAAAYLGLSPASPEIKCLAWLEFPEVSIGLDQASPAQVLEKLLTQKWQLAPEDQDLVVMQHLFDYEREGQPYRLTSTLAVIGENSRQTAMAKTVGLPVGMVAKLILEGRISRRGVVIPVYPDIYGPVLAELKTRGIEFIEKEVPRP